MNKKLIVDMMDEHNTCGPVLQSIMLVLYVFVNISSQ